MPPGRSWQEDKSEMNPSVRWVTVTEQGVWRVGRSPDPIYFAAPPSPAHLDSPTAGNRFDSPTQDYRVCYFATKLDGCFGETLARFRPDPKLLAVSREEGFMLAGEIPADWRHRRLAVRARPVGNGTPTRFVDAEALDTRQVLRGELGELLAYHGHKDLDVAIVRGADRRITRWIGRWAYEQRNEDGTPTYAGIRYLSRLNTRWECWAVFDRVQLEELERRPILRGDDALSRVARCFDLTVF